MQFYVVICRYELHHCKLSIINHYRWSFFLAFCAFLKKNEIVSAKIPVHGNAPFCLGQIPTPCVFRVVTSHVESCWCGRLVPPLCGRAILQSLPNNGPWKTPQSCFDPPPPHVPNVLPNVPPPIVFLWPKDEHRAGAWTKQVQRTRPQPCKVISPRWKLSRIHTVVQFSKIVVFLLKMHRIDRKVAATDGLWSVCHT